MKRHSLYGFNLFQVANMLNALTANFCSSWRSRSSSSCFVLVSDEVITEHFQNLSTILGIDELDVNAQNLSEKTITKGVEMFFYLNSCQNEKERSYWKTLYGTITTVPCCLGFSYEYRSLKEILLPTTKALQSSKSKDGQKIAHKIVKRLASTFKFQYLQPNTDESSIEWTAKMHNVKGQP